MAEKKKAPISTHSQASDKKKALETCIAQIEKNYGKGAIMRLGDPLTLRPCRPARSRSTLLSA